MGAISAQLSPVPLNCVDPVDLASKAIGSLLTGDLAYVESMQGTDNGPFYFLDVASTLPIDGIGVLATSGGNGRWLSLVLYNGLYTTNSAATGSAALVQPRTGATTTTGAPGSVSIPLALLPAGDPYGVDYTVSVLVVDASNPPELYRIDLNATFQVDDLGAATQVTPPTATANARNTAGLVPPAVDATIDNTANLVLTYPGGIDLYWAYSISALYHLNQP